MKQSSSAIARAVILITLVSGAVILWHDYGQRSRPPENILDLLSQEGIPGSIVATIIPGRPVEIEAYGDESTSKDPLGPSTSFPLASLSKPITAAVIRHLIDQEKLQLNDLAITALPELFDVDDPAYAHITVLHLLQHTSGLSQTPSDPVFEDGKPKGCEYAIHSTISRKLEHEPGNHMQYSNTGYCLLGRLIERITGRPYSVTTHDLLKSTPPHSKDLTFGPPAAPAAREGWDLTPNEWRSLGAAGGWFGTAEAVARFFSDDIQDRSISHQSTAPYINYYYGLGWRVTPTKESYQLSHYGVLPGMFAVAVGYPDGRISVALFNGNPSHAEGAFESTKAILDKKLMN